jgi:Transmembrane secretion effector
VDIRPLRESQDFRRLWFGTGISAIGSQITTVAIPYQLCDQTNSTLLVGLLGIAALVPLLTVPLYGGAVADAGPTVSTSSPSPPR